MRRVASKESTRTSAPSPCWLVPGQQTAGLGRVVGVLGRVVFEEFGEGSVDPAILRTREDRLVGFQIVESAPPEPNVPGLLIVEPSAISLFPSDSCALGCLEPGECGFDALLFVGGVVHQEPDDPDALTGAEGCGFLESGADRCEGEWVVLGAPDCGFAVEFDLGIDQTADACLQVVVGPLAEIPVHEVEGFPARGYIGEQFEDVDHGIVVERDVVVISALEWPDLWSTAVREPGSMQMVQAAVDGPERLEATGSVVVAGEKADFAGGRPVVQGADVVPREIATAVG